MSHDETHETLWLTIAHLQSMVDNNQHEFKQAFRQWEMERHALQYTCDNLAERLAALECRMDAAQMFGDSPKVCGGGITQLVRPTYRECACTDKVPFTHTHTHTHTHSVHLASTRTKCKRKGPLELPDLELD